MLKATIYLNYRLVFVCCSLIVCLKLIVFQSLLPAYCLFKITMANDILWNCLKFHRIVVIWWYSPLLLDSIRHQLTSAYRIMVLDAEDDSKFWVFVTTVSLFVCWSCIGWFNVPPQCCSWVTFIFYYCRVFVHCIGGTSIVSYQLAKHYFVSKCIYIISSWRSFSVLFSCG